MAFHQAIIVALLSLGRVFTFPQVSALPADPKRITPPPSGVYDLPKHGWPHDQPPPYYDNPGHAVFCNEGWGDGNCAPPIPIHYGMCTMIPDSNAKGDYMSGFTVVNTADATTRCRLYTDYWCWEPTDDNYYNDYKMQSHNISRTFKCFVCDPTLSETLCLYKDQHLTEQPVLEVEQQYREYQKKKHQKEYEEYLHEMANPPEIDD